MLYIASQREKVKEKWNGAIRGNNHPEIVEECEVPKTVQPTSVIHKNKIISCIIAFLVFVAILTGIVTGGFLGLILFII